MIPQGHIPASAAPGAHEGAETDVRVISRVGLAIAVILALLIVLLFFLYRGLEHRYPVRTSEAAVPSTSIDLPPAPRLQTHPLADLAAVRAEEDLHLTRYAWVDHSQGTAQIPIDRAMVLWLRIYSAAPLISGSPTLSLEKPNSSGTDSQISTNDASFTAPAAAPQIGPATELQIRQQKAEESPHVP